MYVMNAIGLQPLDQVAHTRVVAGILWLGNVALLPRMTVPLPTPVHLPGRNLSQCMPYTSLSCSVREAMSAIGLQPSDKATLILHALRPNSPCVSALS